MRVALFVPCYVDQLCPDVALSTLEVLEALGIEVEVPDAPACCGQVLINTGAAGAARPLALSFVEHFARYEHVVCPSASCVATLRVQAAGVGPAAAALGARVRELCEFLIDVLGVTRFERSFPYRVGLHRSCHAVRELGLAPASELCAAPLSERPRDRLREVVSGLAGAVVVEPTRSDECCGFGGSFALYQSAVSSRMGRDRAHDFARAGAEVLTSADMSCLLHLSGIVRRAALPMTVMHVAQILAGRAGPSRDSQEPERRTRPEVP